MRYGPIRIPRHIVNSFFQPLPNDHCKAPYYALPQSPQSSESVNFLDIKSTDWLTWEQTQYADLALQMGAEHKLDLTSDTTHLIVGSTDTLKYKYVARERDDIKVLRPEWIEAIREYWINDQPMDLDQLALQYRVPTLMNLKICITGFEELSFRAQLQRNVVENGGDYTGDLTKDVTHLIAAKPEGKKYEYGMQWQKKVVSLKWYKDTLERGMQLEESLYHPTVPAAEQGLGAWVRRIRPSPQSSKRPREAPTGLEPSRKLRRTASARLGSQNENLWTDIVGAAGLGDDDKSQRHLKSSSSMPSLPKTLPKTEKVDLVNGEHAESSGDSVAPNVRSGFLSGYSFEMFGFEGKKETIVHNILLENGAKITTEKEHGTLVLMPHDIEENKTTSANAPKTTALTVSELWLERCIWEKSFISPQDYLLGQVIQKRLTLGFSNLTINATGFDPLETLHVSKIITLLGGKYVQIFTPNVSMLLCKSGTSNQQKLQLAQHSSIPVVTEAWLWAVIKTSRKLPVDRYLVQPITGSLLKTESVNTSNRPMSGAAYVEVSTIPLKHQPRPQQGNQPHQGGQRQKGLKSTVQEDATSDRPQLRVHSDLTAEPEQHIDRGSSPETSTSLNSTNGETQNASFVRVEAPLKEVNTNSPVRKACSCDDKNELTQSNNGIYGIQTVDLKMNETSNSRSETKDVLVEDTNGKAVAVQSLNGAIRELLDQQSRKKHSNAIGNPESSTKGRLVGRALSNLSNASATSNVRLSRADSVESMNTDGIGSELVSMPSGNQSNEPLTTVEKGSFSLMGRAKSTLTGIKPSVLGLDDPDMVRGNFQPEEEAPQMTQLGYEDPEEAVLLREKLAEYRRKRSKQGQKESDPKPAIQQKQDRKIRDDDVLLTAGWGAGRRTRNKPRSPPDQEITKF
ncbi:uncharacterized protein A1O9_10994 [Exophiala aquamarina CBS 119918]|uniref:BRCT domain-containing protein n=1 Tax=Exophiala aquamarina CBS 119918 TaxID=1182545 RepID=A0A072NZP8_9EURO|nr:uncharacterized protein A1O9_10994 [Exophiala aquamarina CBS 119918]KEF53086.1 hypothetical protein A1O9_10994 [Exophiala aquamarina CBS 119918]